MSQPKADPPGTPGVRSLLRSAALPLTSASCTAREKRATPDRRREASARGERHPNRLGTSRPVLR